MRTRHALVSLGLVGALACGASAAASAATSDSMSFAHITGSAVAANGPTQLDESVARQRDDNMDDHAVGSLTGLEVEIELPKELVEPIDRVVDIRGSAE